MSADSDVVVRRATPSDAGAVTEIYVASWNRGFAGTGPSRDPVEPGLGELDTIAVRPDAWRCGVGRHLMDVAVDDLTTGYEQAILWTLADYERGRRFYEATGWRASGEARDAGREIAFRRPAGPA